MQGLGCILGACKHHGKLMVAKEEPVLPNILHLICSSQPRDSSVSSVSKKEGENFIYYLIFRYKLHFKTDLLLEYDCPVPFKRKCIQLSL